MRVDVYSKAVLSVIAACLLWLCAERQIWPPVVKADGIQSVFIVGVGTAMRGVLPVEIKNDWLTVGVGGQPITVKIEDQPIEVRPVR